MHVLAAGAYGYGNFGDDCYVDVLQSRLTGCNLDILGQVVESDLRLHSYDATMLAGGGLLYDSVSECGSISLKHYLRYPAIAQWLGKKSFLIGVGAQGPIQPESLVPYLSVLENLDLCTVRDRHTARVLREAGVHSAVLECADLLFAKPIYSKPLRASRVGRFGKPVLGVVASQPGKRLLHPEFSGFEYRIQQALQVLEKDFHLHFFSFDSRSDPWLAESAKSWCSDYSLSSYDPAHPDAINAFIQTLGAVDALVTTRYHGVILSILASTPFLAIGAPSEKVQRECEAIGYPRFLPYVATVDQFVESVHETWAERQELSDLLRRAAPKRKQLALRNFELMAMENENPGRNASRMIPRLASSIRKSLQNSSAGRTLVIWAAGAECWFEATRLFDLLRDFDCVLPPQSRLRHSAMDQRFLLPDPGIFKWAGLPVELKTRLSLQYDNVIVCHAATASKTLDLLEIASASGHRVWEFNVWNHSIHEHSYCERVLEPQGVTA